VEPGSQRKYEYLVSPQQRITVMRTPFLPCSTSKYFTLARIESVVSRREDCFELPGDFSRIMFQLLFCTYIHPPNPRTHPHIREQTLEQHSQQPGILPCLQANALSSSERSNERSIGGSSAGLVMRFRVHPCWENVVGFTPGSLTPCNHAAA